MSYYHKGSLALEQKPHDEGLVTQADKQGQRYLIENLQRVMPQAGIIAEESDIRSSEQEYCWVIDPIDGTTNFVHGVPYFCISVALTYQGKPLLGATYQPVIDEFFYAQQGYGAYVNGVKIQVSDPQRASKGNLLIAVPYLDPAYNRIVTQMHQSTGEKYTTRHMGSVALDLAYVAAGRMDGILFTDLAWWDVAAGIVLIEQAGGKITDFNGQQVRQGYGSCVAGSSIVHGTLTTLIGCYA